MIAAAFRGLAIGLAVACLSIAPVLGQSKAAASDAGAFIGALAEKAIPVLTNIDIPEDQRERRFRELMDEGFDVSLIGRMVLGRYWNQASQTEKTEFVELLEDYLVQLYADRFTDYQNVTLQVNNTRSEDQGAIVQSVLLRPQGAPVQLDWRVERQNDRFIVTDMVVEGISMVITQRSEFASIIRQSGGVAGLIDLLREKTGG